MAHDPTELAGLNAAELRLRLFTKTENLPSDVTRLPFKSIHLNRSPMVMGHLRLVSDAKALRWGIGVAAQLENAAKARDLPDMSAIWPEVFARPVGPAPDVDEDLYGGFVSDKDHRRLLEFRTLNVAQSNSMGDARSTFDDPRLDMMVFRYRARNFPGTLTAQEALTWQAHLQACWSAGEGGRRTVVGVIAELEQLRAQVPTAGLAVLDQLEDYLKALPLVAMSS